MFPILKDFSAYCIHVCSVQTMSSSVYTRWNQSRNRETSCYELKMNIKPCWHWDTIRKVKPQSAHIQDKQLTSNSIKMDYKMSKNPFTMVRVRRKKNILGLNRKTTEGLTLLHSPISTTTWSILQHNPRGYNYLRCQLIYYQRSHLKPVLLDSSKYTHNTRRCMRNVLANI